jgi:hypothetical protein
MQFFSHEEIERVFREVCAAEQNLPEVPSDPTPAVPVPREMPPEILVTRLTNSVS